MNTPELIGSGALWLAIPVAMLAGLVSFLSPCVLPLVPGYLGFISGAVGVRSDPSTGSGSGTAGSGGGTTGSGGGTTGSGSGTTGSGSGTTGSGSGTTGSGSGVGSGSGGSRGRLVLGVLLFILGFSIVFIGFTVIGGAVSVFFLQWGELITRVLGVVIIAMGLVFLGLFGFAQREFRMHVTSKTGLIGAPLLGFALGIGWAPCIGPTLTAITAVSWTLGDPWRAGFLGLAYSLGLGIPFLLVALGFGWATKTIGFLRRHIRVVNIAGGILLILLGILMVSGFWTDIMSRLTAVMGSVFLPL